MPQSVEMFDSPRAGDIVLFAATDWSFNKDDQGGHGSCLPRDMHMPMKVVYRKDSPPGPAGRAFIEQLRACKAP